MQDVCYFCAMIERIYQQYQRTPHIQTDTRKLKKDELFFALKGPQFDANDFVAQALETGASMVVCERFTGKDNRVIVVSNALQTLQDLAAHHRRQFEIPFLAITGSNGKTTTKELVHRVLSTSFKTYTTQGNLNNHIGVPLTILKIKPDAEMAVIEMGANHLGEIASYCTYTMPTHALITNIGKAHLEGFGGVENVKFAKGELFDWVNQHDGFAFVNADDPQVLALSAPIGQKTLYGNFTELSTVKGRAIAPHHFLEVDLQLPFEDLVKTQLVGIYNLSNVLAAICVGNHFEIEPQRMKQAIESYAPGSSRSQLVYLNSNEIILDAYNANPGSMQAAIENFAAMKGDKKILLLGDMKELGADSLEEHCKIGRLIQKYSWEKVVLVGEWFSKVPGDDFIHFTTSSAARTWFEAQHISNAQILVKGSRSMKMEDIVDSGIGNEL